MLKFKKIKKIQQLKKIVEKLKKDGKKVGIVTGSFEIIHIDYIKLFRFAKEHADILIIGLVNDRNIRISKGKNRPLFNFSQRAQVLSDLSTVDYIFKIDKVVECIPTEIEKLYKTIYKTIKPDYIISNKKADKYIVNKRNAIKGMNIKILQPINNNPISIAQLFDGKRYYKSFQ